MLWKQTEDCVDVEQTVLPSAAVHGCLPTGFVHPPPAFLADICSCAARNLSLPERVSVVVGIARKRMGNAESQALPQSS